MKTNRTPIVLKSGRPDLLLTDCAFCPAISNSTSFTAISLAESSSPSHTFPKAPLPSSFPLFHCRQWISSGSASLELLLSTFSSSVDSPWPESSPAVGTWGSGTGTPMASVAGPLTKDVMYSSVVLASE